MALGTAGALAQLRDWIDGRGALVQNADGWSDADLAAFCDGWDGERVRLLVTPDGEGRARLGPGVGLVASLLPWAEIVRLDPVPSGLYEAMWRGAEAAGRLDLVAHRGRFVDCGTPRRYLQANRLAAADSGEADADGSLVDPTAVGVGSARVVGGGAGRVRGRLGERLGRLGRLGGGGRGTTGGQRAGGPAHRGGSVMATGTGAAAGAAAAWTARSWPQAASMSVPRFWRTVAFTPSERSRSRKARDPARRGAPGRRSPASG